MLAYQSYHTFASLMYSRLKSKPLEDVAIILSDESQTITYGDLFKQSTRISLHLSKLKVRKGDVIAIVSGNCLEYFLSALATIYLGACLHPITDGLTQGELKQLLLQSRPSVIFCTKSSLEKIVSFRDECKFIKDIISFDEVSEENIILFKDWLKDCGTFETVEVDSTIKGHEDCIILNSSGTTGSSKCVLHSQEVFMGNILFYPNPDLFGLTKSDITIAYMPLQHGYGFSITMASLVVGCRIIMMKKFEPVTFLELISRNRVPRLFLVPTLMHFFYKSDLIDKYDLSSLREIFCSSAPLRRDIEESVKRRLGLVHIRQFYGLSEACVVSMIPKDSTTYNSGSSGRIIPNVTVRVKNPETQEILPDGRIGEIFVRSPYLMKGYVNNEAATRNAFDSDNFLRTGDLGYCSDGHIYITGRCKEVFKYKGFQVPVLEIEELLCRMEGVEEAVIINKSDARYGDLATAVIVRENGSTITENDVQKYVSKNLSEEKWVHGGVIFVNCIPRTETGKIMKRYLREKLFGC